MTEAKKREKVMRGLEAHANPKTCETCAGEECPYYNRGGCHTEVTCSSFLAADALALLKEQEPRVMTLEEVEKTDEWMWAEYVSGYCGWQRPDEEDDYLNMIAWNDSTVDRKDYYGKTWRCWTARPTEEQRKAVKWDG